MDDKDTPQIRHRHLSMRGTSFTARGIPFPMLGMLIARVRFSACLGDEYAYLAIARDTREQSVQRSIRAIDQGRKPNERLGFLLGGSQSNSIAVSAASSAPNKVPPMAITQQPGPTRFLPSWSNRKRG